MKFNHTAHRALWNWLAENTHLDKEDWPGWSWKGGEYDGQENDCFACEYAKVESFYDEQYCGDCPLDWDAHDCVSGLYGEWCSPSNMYAGKSARIARQIANLPVNPGVECE